MSRVPYTSTIGSIMYALICNRPDISYALRIMNGYQDNPRDSHWMVVKNILKYLKITKDMFLVYCDRKE